MLIILNQHIIWFVCFLFLFARKMNDSIIDHVDIMGEVTYLQERFYSIY